MSRSCINIGGNTTVGQNLGSGIEVYAGKSGASALQFKTLSSLDGTSLAITCDGDNIFLSAATGGGTPGGADTNVQFNNGGAFSGSSNLLWEEDCKKLTISSSVVPTIHLRGTGGSSLLSFCTSGSYSRIVAYDSGGLDVRGECKLYLATSSTVDAQVAIGVTSVGGSFLTITDTNTTDCNITMNVRTAAGCALLVCKDGKVSMPELPAKTTETNVAYIDASGNLSCGVAASGGGFTASNNGLCDNGTTVGLGGTLAANTIINGGTHNLTIGTSASDLPLLTICADKTRIGNNGLSLGNWGTLGSNADASLILADANSTNDGWLSLAMGDRICIPSNARAVFAGGSANTIGSCPIFACSCAFNFSLNNSETNVDYGARAAGSAILGGCNHQINATGVRSAIIGGGENYIKGEANNSIILGGFGNEVAYNTDGVAILGSNDVTATTNNTTYMTNVLACGATICFNNLPAKSTETDAVYIDANGKLSCGAAGSSGGGLSAAANGLCDDGATVSLGGALTGDTIIDMGVHRYCFGRTIAGGVTRHRMQSSGTGGGYIIEETQSTSGGNNYCASTTNSSNTIGASVILCAENETTSKDYQVRVNTNGICVTGGKNGVYCACLKMTTGETVFYDNSNAGGIVYAADYSADYTPRSLVDVSYVTGRTDAFAALTSNSSVSWSTTGGLNKTWSINATSRTLTLTGVASGMYGTVKVTVTTGTPTITLAGSGITFKGNGSLAALATGTYILAWVATSATTVEWNIGQYS